MTSCLCEYKLGWITIVLRRERDVTQQKVFVSFWHRRASIKTEIELNYHYHEKSKSCDPRGVLSFWHSWGSRRTERINAWQSCFINVTMEHVQIAVLFKRLTNVSKVQVNLLRNLLKLIKLPTQWRSCSDCTLEHIVFYWILLKHSKDKLEDKVSLKRLSRVNFGKLKRS
jgi:hypothetical protein